MKAKKLLIILGILFVVLTLILLFVLGVFEFASIFTSHDIDPTVTNIKKVSETSNYVIYEMTFRDYNPSSPKCKEFPASQYTASTPLSIQPSGMYYDITTDPPLFLTYDLSDLSRDVEPELVSVDMNFVINNYVSCGGAYMGQAIISNENVVCRVVSDKNMDCILSFDVDGLSASGSVGTMSGIFRIKILKEGIECLEDIHCEEGEECINNICKVKEVFVCNDWDRKCDNDNIVVCKNNGWVFEKACLDNQQCEDGECVLKEIPAPTPPSPSIGEWISIQWNKFWEWFKGLF